MAQLQYVITIEWQKVVEEAGKISSYEGKNAITGAGESNYPEVHITEQDYPLLVTHIEEGSYAVESALGSLVDIVVVTGSEVESGTSTYKFTVDGARTSNSNLDNMLTETLATYIIAQWLSDKTPNRVEFYTNLFKQMIVSITSSLTRKSAPTLS